MRSEQRLQHWTPLLPWSHLPLPLPPLLLLLFLYLFLWLSLH
jgi:hypothetical protein